MPHAQAKSHTDASPADLEKLLTLLQDTNIEGVSGTALEADGYLHFTVGHGAEADVHALLVDAGYHPKWTTDLFHQELDNNQALSNPGVLLGIIQEAKGQNFANGRAIDTVLTGLSTDNPSRFYVQVTFVGSDWTEEPPPVQP